MERSAYLLFSLQLPQVAIIATVCLVPVAVLHLSKGYIATTLK